MKMVKLIKQLIIMISLVALNFAGCSNPVENATALPSELYVEQEINGTLGGVILLNGQYQNAYGDTVTADIKLNIPENSITGIKKISIRTDRFNPSLEFQPAAVFSNTLKLTVSFTGLKVDRYGLQPGKCDFVYLADNGTVEVIISDGIKVDHFSKLVKVTNAKITHFSRYGFIRKD